MSKAVQNSPCAGKTCQIGPSWASGESFVPHMRREGVSRESFVPKRQGVVVVGRIMSCSGVVLVPVGGLWRRPGAAHGHCGRALRAPGVLHAGGGGGFALHEAFGRRVAGVSDPRVVQFPPLLSAASGFVRARGFPCALMGAHTLSLRSRNVTVSQVCSRHIQCRLCHRIRAGTPAQGASITSTTTRP